MVLAEPSGAISGLARERLAVIDDPAELALIDALCAGLPLVPRPYRELGRQIGLSEEEVIGHISRLREEGVIKRFGIVVRHHELGYNANAMAVWQVPEEEVDGIGHLLGRFPEISLCYRRRPAPPRWPYNLYCMVHGRDRQWVHDVLEKISRECGLDRFPHQLLFSSRRFKQQGARYRLSEARD